MGQTTYQLVQDFFHQQYIWKTSLQAIFKVAKSSQFHNMQKQYHTCMHTYAHISSWHMYTLCEECSYIHNCMCKKNDMFIMFTWLSSFYNTTFEQELTVTLASSHIQSERPPVPQAFAAGGALQELAWHRRWWFWCCCWCCCCCCCCCCCRCCCCCCCCWWWWWWWWWCWWWRRWWLLLYVPLFRYLVRWSQPSSYLKHMIQAT